AAARLNSLARTSGRWGFAARASGHGAGVSVSAAMPAATFSPRLASTLSGWSAIELLEPPSSALAPTPTATVALAVAPTKFPASTPDAREAVGAITVHTRIPP